MKRASILGWLVIVIAGCSSAQGLDPDVGETTATADSTASEPRPDPPVLPTMDPAFTNDRSASPPVTSEPTTATPTATTVTPTATVTPSPAVLQGDVVVPSSIVLYDPGQAFLKPESAQALGQVAELLAKRPEITHLRIEVHTDSDGSDAANLKLSTARALAVAKELTGLGVDCKRLVAVGFGETKPIAPNDTPASKAKNRRTEFFVATLRGKPLGSKPVDGGGSIAGDPCK